MLKFQLNEYCCLLVACFSISIATCVQAGGEDLDRKMSPEEHQHFRQSLRDFSDNAYSDHDEIEARRKALRERLRSADGDNDGTISRSEAENSFPGLAKHFDEIDTNHDGLINREEIQAARDKKREIKRESRKDKLKKLDKHRKSTEN